jgi:hypothetical protein
MMKEETCWLCLRASMDRILEASRRLFSGDVKAAHGVGVRAARLLRDAYLKSPAKVSGRKTDSLIGGALYLACMLEGRWMTQREVADEALEQRVTETSVRSSYQLLSELLDVEFPEGSGRGTLEGYTRVG